MTKPKTRGDKDHGSYLLAVQNGNKQKKRDAKHVNDDKSKVKKPKVTQPKTPAIHEPPH